MDIETLVSGFLEILCVQELKLREIVSNLRFKLTWKFGGYEKLLYS